MIPPRKGSRKVVLRGVFAGAKVRRSKDWNWDDQDGGPGQLGKVLSIDEEYKDTFRSVANVKWQVSDFGNIYRVGYHGKVDIQCTEAAANGQAYIDHLPIVGKQQPLSVRISQPLVQPSPPLLSQAPKKERGKFNVNDKVRISVTPEELEVLQADHGGFNPQMLAVVGLTGSVHRVTTTNSMQTTYQLLTFFCTIFKIS